MVPIGGDLQPRAFMADQATVRTADSCSFLALVLRKELCGRLDAVGHAFEWSDVKQDLEALQETTIEDNGKRLAIRSSMPRNPGQGVSGSKSGLISSTYLAGYTRTESHTNVKGDHIHTP